MHAEIGILGGGFAGSLAATLLSRAGRDAVLLDPSQHPRFRIGESSTPTADLLLRQLADRYSVPELDPLTRYRTWRDAYPNLRCGCKRGFSYFRHHPGQSFQANGQHTNELLVAASTSDDSADTHWLRSDIDLFLFRLAERSATAWDGVEFRSIVRRESGWIVEVMRQSESARFEFDYLIDGSGAAGVLGDVLDLHDQSAEMFTKTRAIYSHCLDVASWTQQLRATTPNWVDDHPFDADLAAQHHLVDEGWMWMLRFDGNLTSVGLMLDMHGVQAPVGRSPTDEWRAVLGRYPSLVALMERTRLADSPGKWIGAPRLQRRWSQAAGDNWAMLPGTAGFVDPLHSTGIAHTIAGVARLVELIERQWGKAALHASSNSYGRAVWRELNHIDKLVAGCYAAMPSFSRFAAFSMLYFVSTVVFENQCKDADAFERLGDYLCADNRQMLELVDESLRRVRDATISDADFRDWLFAQIAPLQTAGLGVATARNMYQHTAAE